MHRAYSNALHNVKELWALFFVLASVAWFFLIQLEMCFLDVKDLLRVKISRRFGWQLHFASFGRYGGRETELYS